LVIRLRRDGNDFRRRFSPGSGDQFLAGGGRFLDRTEYPDHLFWLKQHGFTGRAEHHVTRKRCLVVALNVVLQILQRDAGVLREWCGESGENSCEIQG
jgi:hypothetical protein